MYRNPPAAPPSPSAPSDSELVAAIAAEDRQALAALYDRHAPRLLHLAERLMRNPVDAEDLLHDLFVEVYQRAKSYDVNRGSVLGWLVMRLRSGAIDRLRAPAYRRLVAMTGELPPPAGEELLITSEPLGDTLTQAMKELPQDTQTILNLVYFKGMSLPEVASSMVLPLGTVKSRLHRALRSLRAAVGENGEPSPPAGLRDRGA